MLRRILPILLLLATPLTAYAGRGFWYSDLYDNIVVVTIKEVPKGDFTYANPPTIKAEVNEALSGELKGPYSVTWASPPADTEVPSKEWNDTKIVPPAVGSQYILFALRQDTTDDGELKPTTLWVPGDGQWPLTDKNRARALDELKKHQEAEKAYQLEYEKKQAQRKAALADWRASLTDEKLAAAVKQADVVAVGKVASQQIPENIIDFQVSEFIKGQKAKDFAKNDLYYVRVAVSKETASLLDSDSEYLLLLSEKDLQKDASVPRYQPVAGGVLPANAPALKIARTPSK